jgi:cholesterol transport system auxiliary component
LQLAWLTTGCSSVLAPVQSPATALIDRLPADVPRAARTRGVLLLNEPTCRPAYDTTHMAYSSREHQVDFFARHEWAERPGQMLQPLLARTLEAAHCCTAVVAPPYSGAYDFSLRTEVGELLQDFTVAPPRLRLALRIVLADRTRILASREFAVAEPMHRADAEAGVDAANVAVAKALSGIAQAVVDALG